MHILFHALSCTHKRKLKEKEFCCLKYFAPSNSLGVEPGTGEDIFPTFVSSLLHVGIITRHIYVFSHNV